MKCSISKRFAGAWKGSVASRVLLIGILFPAVICANPAGEDVAAGSAAFDRVGSTLTITTSDRVIINWQDFSIGASELTKFVQPSVSSAALNRVVSGNPSAIYGTLQANGQIFLINPSGILVGNGAVINTGGFTASTLDLNNSEFLAGGNLNFIGNSTAKVENQGRINAIGGDIFLIARHVENSGELNAPDGTVGLAAGTEVLISQAGEEKIFVKPSRSGESASGIGVLNSGTIRAARAELVATGNIYALAINNTGVIRANGVTTRNGHVFLTANGGSIKSSGTITAKNQNRSGGKIAVRARDIVLTGPSILNASGGGGSVVVVAEDAARIHGNILVLGPAGFVETSGKGYLEVLNTPEIGAGGTWLIDPRDLTIVAGAGSSGTTTTPGPTFTSSADSSTLGVTLINTALNAGNNVVVQTGATGAQAGDLTMAAGVNIQKTAGGAASLTMNAHNDMTLNDITSSSGALAIVLNADSDNSGAGGLTLNGNLGSNGGDVTLNGVDIAMNADVNAGAGMVTIHGKGGLIEQLFGVGAVSADSLVLTGSGLFNIKQNINDVNTFAANVTGSLTYRDVNIVTIGTVGGVSGVHAAGGLVSVVAQDSITVNDTAVAGDDVQATSVVDLTSDNLFINGTVSGSRVTLRVYSPGQQINLGGADSGSQLGLTSAEINRVTTPWLRIGDKITGDIIITAPIAPSGSPVLNLITAGAVIDANGAGPDITVANLAITSATGTGSGNAIETAISNFAFNNTTSGSVEISNTGALTIAPAGILGIPTSSNAGGAVTLTATGPITFAVNTTAAGNLTATVPETAASGEDVTVNGGVTVRSTGGNVAITAGDNILVTGNVRSDTGNVTIIAGNDLRYDGAIQAGNNITLVVDNDFPVRPGIGSGLLINNGTLNAGGRYLVYAVQPSQVSNPAALAPPAQWLFSTYFDEAAGLLGNILAFKVGPPVIPPVIPPGGGGGGGGGVGGGGLLTAFLDDVTLERQYLHLPPKGPYGIYYAMAPSISNLEPAPPSDLSLDPAPPGVSRKVRRQTSNPAPQLSGSSSFGAYGGGQTYSSGPVAGNIPDEKTLEVAP